MENVKRIMGDRICYATQEYECLNGADALIIATEWSLFRTPDFDKMAKVMKGKVVFDGRNLFSLDAMERLGYHYESVGRRKIG
jgi:UDPglucose 6-dehydrogenase